MAIRYGKRAIRAVEELEGRKLNKIEKRIVLEEGFSDEPYRDTKGILTTGVGQTGEFANMLFSECVKHFEDKCRMWFVRFDKYPDYLKEEFIQSAYRGDLGQSPKTRKLIDKGLYWLAAQEFLDNEEYLNPDTPIGIKDRMRSVSAALNRYAEEEIYGT